MRAAPGVDDGLRRGTDNTSTVRPPVSGLPARRERVDHDGDTRHRTSTTRRTSDSAHPPPRGPRAATGAQGAVL